MKGEEMGKYVTISAIHIVTARTTEHLRLVSGFLVCQVPICGYLPESECNEQTTGTAIEQTPADLHIERCTDSSTNANKLNVSRLQLSVCVIVNAADIVRSN